MTAGFDVGRRLLETLLGFLLGEMRIGKLLHAVDIVVTTGLLAVSGLIPVANIQIHGECDEDDDSKNDNHFNASL